MNIYLEDDKRDLNAGDIFVKDRSAGELPSESKDQYNWCEKYIPYEGPHWFIRFAK